MKTKLTLIFFMTRYSWQYSLIASCFGVVSGGVVSHIAFGLHPRILNNDFALPCTVISWYLMNYSPKDIVFYLYHNFIPLKIVSEALHRVHQMRSLMTGIGLGRTHGTPYVGALVGGLVAGTTSSISNAFFSGNPSPLQKPGYTFTVLSWASVLIVSDILGKYSYNIIIIYLVLVEIYFGVSGTIIPEPFPLNIFSKLFTTILNLHNPNARRIKDKNN